MEEPRADAAAQKLSVADILREESLGLQLLSGKTSTVRTIGVPRPQKLGLVLAGHLEHLSAEKIQILGESETTYLSRLDPQHLRKISGELFSHPLPLLIVTKDLTPPEAFLRAADAAGVAVLRTAERTSSFIRRLISFLDKNLAPTTSIHGVLMSVDGVGVLLLGRSGIGKSECALDLIFQGHRLVADDLIILKKMGPGIIVGSGPEIIKHHMEIRGLGIINIQDLFGVVSVVDTARVELVIQLEIWDQATGTDRLGLEEKSFHILDQPIPKVEIPVSPGRNLSVIVEVAVRNHLLKKGGFNAPRNVERVLREKIREGGEPHAE